MRYLLSPLGPGLANKAGANIDIFAFPPRAGVGRSPLSIITHSSRVKMNGKAALDFGVHVSKSEVLIMDTWFWAYRRLKKGLEAPGDVSRTPDWQKLEALAKGLTHPVWLKGDGLFSRAKSWLSRQQKEIAFIRLNWNDDDEKTTAFLLGLEVAFECAVNELNYLERASKEKKGR